MLNNLLNKFWQFLKTRWAYFVSLIFIWAIPIYMLNETVALTQVSNGFKITFMGCLVVFVLFLAFRKKIYAVINKRPHGLIRGVLLCLDKGITYGLVLGVLWAINSFSDKLYHWWLLCGISIGIGLIFIMIDEHLAKPKNEGEV